jgi:hypothetical protein
VADGSIWDEVLDTEHSIVVRTYIERWPRKNRAPEKVLIVVVEPDDEARNRCPRCGNRGVPVESGVRRWRTLDVHGKRCYLESAVPRIECAEHGKITASVPWARHDDRFTCRSRITQHGWPRRRRGRKPPLSCGSPGRRSRASSPASPRTRRPAWTASRACG